MGGSNVDGVLVEMSGIVVVCLSETVSGLGSAGVATAGDRVASVDGASGVSSACDAVAAAGGSAMTAVRVNASVAAPASLGCVYVCVRVCVYCIGTPAQREQL